MGLYICVTYSVLKYKESWSIVYMKRWLDNEMLKRSLFLDSDEVWKGVGLDERRVIFGKCLAEWKP